MEIINYKTAKLNPKKKYIISIPVSKGEKRADDIVNKVELAFKSMGILNVKAMPYQISVFEIEE